MKYPCLATACLSLIVLIAVQPQQVYSQSIDSTLAKFERYHQQTPLEKAYLHTDKEVYAQGETLWFSAYLVKASSHLPGSLSTLLYAELINPENETLSTLSIKIEEGTGAGSFFLADTLAEGTYTLRAYTHYMRNFDDGYFFSKPIKLLSHNRDSIGEDQSRPYSAIDFQLFPEGGQLINGTVNNMAFRITNEKGYGMDITAKIVNGRDEEILQFATQHLGMGVFSFIPKEGEQYFAKYEMDGLPPSSVPLPMAKSEGYQLSVRQNAGNTHVTVKATQGLDFDGCFVLAHTRGKVVSVFRAKPGKQFIYHTIKNDQLPSGIVHLTVFKSGKPVLERLVYIDNPSEQPILTPTLRNKKLKPREKAYFDLDLKSPDSLLLSANLSVSVLRETDGANKTDIENFMLLTSDLKGSIEHPEYYMGDSPDRLKSLDLLMLTHGWRRFDWQDILADSLPSVEYFPEKGFSIEGQVVKYINHKKGRPGRVALSFLEDMNFQQESETQPDGTFWFDGLQIEDTMTAVIRTLEMDGKKKRKKAEGEEVRDKGSFITHHERKNPDVTTKPLESYGAKESYRRQLDSRREIEQIDMAFDENTIVLEEVEVLAKRSRKNDPFYRESMTTYIRPYSRNVVDSFPDTDHYTNIYQLVQRLFAGIKVNGTYPDQYFTIRGKPLGVTLDGMPAHPIILNSLLPETVEFIDLQRSGYNSALGNTIHIYFRKTFPPLDPQGLLVKEIIGYRQPDEFYIPKYDIMTNEEKIKPDYRATQYWNPKVRVSDGKASFDYYTSDNKGSFIMYLEGITIDGRIIKSQLGFRVE